MVFFTIDPVIAENELGIKCIYDIISILKEDGKIEYNKYNIGMITIKLKEEN